MPTNGDLTPWTERGGDVAQQMSDCRRRTAKSHQGKGWEEVTEAAIRALNARTDADGKPQPLVAILWGRNAQSSSHC